jgi:hypothetical protein
LGPVRKVDVSSVLVQQAAAIEFQKCYTEVEGSSHSKENLIQYMIPKELYNIWRVASSNSYQKKYHDRYNPKSPTDKTVISSIYPTDPPRTKL